MSRRPAHLGDLLRAAGALGVSDPAGLTALAAAMGLAPPGAHPAPARTGRGRTASARPGGSTDRGRGAQTRAGRPEPDPAAGPAGPGRQPAEHPEHPMCPQRPAPPDPGAPDAVPPVAPAPAPVGPGAGVGAEPAVEPGPPPLTGGSLLLIRPARQAPGREGGRALWREATAPGEGEGDGGELLGGTELFDVPWSTAPPRPASPWNPQTERAIFLAVASRYMTGRAVDQPRLMELVIRSLAGGRVTRPRVPYRQRPTTRAGALLLIDRGESMRPFRHDQEWVTRLAGRILPPGALRILDLRITRGVSADRGRSWEPHPVPPRGRPVLLLSDLGHLQPPLPGRHHASPAGWLPYLRRLREAGSPVVCLTPYPAQEYPSAVRQTVTLIPLDRRVSVRQAQTAARRDRRRAGRPR